MVRQEQEPPAWWPTTSESPTTRDGKADLSDCGPESLPPELFPLCGVMVGLLL